MGKVIVSEDGGPGEPIVPGTESAHLGPTQSEEEEGGKDTLDSQAAEWVNLYADYLYRYAMLRLRDKQASEDVVQETFLAALQSFKNFKGRSSVKTWLVNILKHKIVDHIRRCCRERRSADSGGVLDDWMEDAFNEHGHWNFASGKHPKCAWVDSDPEAAYDRQRFWTVLQGSLAHLPTRVAQAFVLREIDGLETEEICSTMNISRNNLWVMLHRARLFLSHSLETDGFSVDRPRGQKQRA
ncbi:MAG TPA: sigma-70 family RNA polymerase sigma factor [Acidobacteriota bacterium]|nr:sigma-70 family RNA polymerase sigma factor [Acidobacteriota bacterium]